MSNKKMIFKTLGHIFLGLFIFIIIGSFIIPYLFFPFLILTHLCKGLGCTIYLLFSPFVLLVSVIFYTLSRMSGGMVKEKLSETGSNNTLIKRLFLGIVLIVLGFILSLNSFIFGRIDSITIFIGLFFLLSSIVQLIVNYFKNKKSITLADE